MPRPSASPAPTSEIVVYENGGDLRLDVRTDGETVWLTQEQMCRLFGRTQPVIARHIAHIFKEGELEKKVVYAKIAYTTPHGSLPAELDIKQVKQGMSYLVQQLAPPAPKPKPKIGFAQARR